MCRLVALPLLGHVNQLNGPISSTAWRERSKTPWRISDSNTTGSQRAREKASDENLVIAERSNGSGRHNHPHDETNIYEDGRDFGHFLRSLVAPHSHDATDSLDQALESSTDGIRAVALSLVILLVTAGIEALVVAASGSVALLSDTLHNAADALTAMPLWLAFKLGRRPPTRRFTFGYGKTEDLAGVAVIALIAASAGFAAFEAVERLIHPHPVTHIGYVMAAAVVGALGNEIVALYRIKVGRRIGSAALEADGLHARADGVTSLLVLAGAIAVAFGLHRADAVVGLLITVAILIVGYHAVRNVGRRLLDAFDPALVEHITMTVSSLDGVMKVTEVRARWVGHRLLAQVRLNVDGNFSVTAAHEIAEDAYHELLHHVPNLSDAIIHADPSTTEVDPHAATAHHRRGD